MQKPPSPHRWGLAHSFRSEREEGCANKVHGAPEGIPRWLGKESPPPPPRHSARRRPRPGLAHPRTSAPRRPRAGGSRGCNGSCRSRQCSCKCLCRRRTALPRTRSHLRRTRQQGDVKGVPGAKAALGHPPAPLTHAVVVLRVRPVARVAMAGVAGGALDALPVATDVLVEPTLVCLCRPRWGVWGWQVRKLSREHSLSAMSPVRTSVPHS